MESEPLIEELKNEIEGNGSIKYIKELLHWGHFDVNTMWKDEDDDEWFFLLKAAYLNKPKIVKVLLEEGADPNLKDRGGYTALHLASDMNHSQVVEELLKHPSIDPNVQNRYGYTALICASSGGDLQVAIELLKHPKIDPNIQRADGMTALMEASRRGRSQVVEEILKHPKIDPNIQRPDGSTALILMSKKGISQAIRLLLKLPNIDLTIENNEGFNAWDIAPSHIREKFPELNPNNTKAIDKTFEDKIVLLKTICEGLCDTLPIEKQKEFKKILNQI